MWLRRRGLRGLGGVFPRVMPIKGLILTNHTQINNPLNAKTTTKLNHSKEDKYKKPEMPGIESKAANVAHKLVTGGLVLFSLYATFEIGRNISINIEENKRKQAVSLVYFDLN